MMEIMTPTQILMKNGYDGQHVDDSFLQKSFNDFQTHFEQIKEQKINISIKTLTGKSFEVELSVSSQVVNLLDKIYEKEKIPHNQIRLVHNGKHIPNEKIPLIWHFVSLETTPIIHLILKLRGGMLHPSSGREGYESLDVCVHKAEEIRKLAVALSSMEGGGGGGYQLNNPIICDATKAVTILEIALQKQKNILVKNIQKTMFYSPSCEQMKSEDTISWERIRILIKKIN